MKKSDRIKKNEEIAKIVSLRKRVISNFFIIYYQPASTSLRTAISVSKKYGNSVERNHAKRVVRELITPNINKYNFNIVVVIRLDFKKANYKELENSMNYLLNKINYNLYKQKQNKQGY